VLVLALPLVIAEAELDQSLEQSLRA